MESIKRQLLFIPLLIVFPASRIHRSVEWSLLLSLGHWVSPLTFTGAAVKVAVSMNSQQRHVFDL